MDIKIQYNPFEAEVLGINPYYCYDSYYKSVLVDFFPRSDLTHTVL